MLAAPKKRAMSEHLRAKGYGNAIVPEVAAQFIIAADHAMREAA
jgi:hypothetical protein